MPISGNRALLETAIADGNKEAFKRLIQLEGSLENHPEQAVPLLHILLSKMSKDKSFDVSQELSQLECRRLVANAKESGSLEIKTSFGNTALHMAASLGHLTLCKELLSNGAKLNATNNRYQTPLHCTISNGTPKIAELFIAQNNSPLDAKDNSDKTPLQLCSLNLSSGTGDKLANLEIATKLIEHGAEFRLPRTIFGKPITGNYCHTFTKLNQVAQTSLQSSHTNEELKQASARLLEALNNKLKHTHLLASREPTSTNLDSSSALGTNPATASASPANASPIGSTISLSAKDRNKFGTLRLDNLHNGDSIVDFEEEEKGFHKPLPALDAVTANRASPRSVGREYHF